MATNATLIHDTDRSVDGSYRLGEFSSYPDAARLVLRLFDAGFPVLHVRIIDVGPHRAEPSGHVAEGRAGLIGAGLGAWLGMLTGLVLVLVLTGVAWLDVLLGAVLIGSVAGGVMGLIIHWGTDGRGDREKPRRYVVEVDSAHTEDAVDALGRA
ncbi:hypothetical protein [Actinoplanes sp. GCM10030250]|uniref:hypothetical protein n=1 Tax=Actinoplanes sp. GCM10030250 TaxID=3273376 RepID=UPI0036188CA1